LICLVAFHPQPSHDRDDICSPEQEIESSDQVFSGVVPDLDTILDTKPLDPSNLDYGESLCVPFIDQPDGKNQKIFIIIFDSFHCLEISIIKQTLTTSTLTTEYFEPKKDKNNIGHIMISYNHSTKTICTKIAQALKVKINKNPMIDYSNLDLEFKLSCLD
jgi:hypothetical protein